MCNTLITIYTVCGHKFEKPIQCSRATVEGKKCIYIPKETKVDPDSRGAWACPKGCGQRYAMAGFGWNDLVLGGY
jgi:hypothetical protein